MKLVKTIMGTAGILFIASMLLCSCQSTKTNGSTTVSGDSDYSDSADDETAITVNDTDKSTADSYDTVADDSRESEPKQESFFSRLTQGSVKFKEVGSFDLSTMGLNSKVKKQEATFLIDEKTYNAGFGSPILAAYCVMLMDQKTRSVYINAVNSYLKDFENKKLDRKDKKSYKKYGKSKATIYWGMVKSQTSNYAYPEAFFGYTFKEKSPYFTITMYPTVNEKRKVDDSVAEESMIVNFYFTKAQARTLADFLAEDNLYNFFGGNTPLVDETPAVDEY
jgi:hypothetical protein